MAEDNDNEAKKGDEKPNIFYTIEIKDNGDTYPLSIRVKPTTQIFKVLTAWCKKFALVIEEWVFTCDGEQINIKDGNGHPTTQTVSDLGIDEDVQIDAFRHQVGGQ